MSQIDLSKECSLEEFYDNKTKIAASISRGENENAVTLSKQYLDDWRGCPDFSAEFYYLQSIAFAALAEFGSAVTAINSSIDVVEKNKSSIYMGHIDLINYKRTKANFCSVGGGCQEKEIRYEILGLIDNAIKEDAAKEFFYHNHEMKAVLNFDLSYMYLKLNSCKDVLDPLQVAEEVIKQGLVINTEQRFLEYRGLSYLYGVRCMNGFEGEVVKKDILEGWIKQNKFESVYLRAVEKEAK